MAKKVRFDVVQPWSQDSNCSAPRPETHLNYFTCTLGGAARWNKEHTHPFQTVNDLIDAQARELRQRPALNFAGGCHAEDGKEMKSGMLKQRHYMYLRSHIKFLAQTSPTENSEIIPWQLQSDFAGACRLRAVWELGQ